MKKILIIGEKSYVGLSVRSYLAGRSGYGVDIISSRNLSWEKYGFHPYDVVFNVSGLCHADARQGTPEQYMKINAELPVAIAKKAKKECVRQFIQMSSMIVYGNMSRIDIPKRIFLDTKPIPSNIYGESKLCAEKGLTALNDTTFKVTIIRPPLIYGENARDNFPRLVKFAMHAPLFPDIANEQSMIYVDNFCEFVRMVIDNEEEGIFMPQDSEYVTTSDLVKSIAQLSNNKLYLTKFFNPLIYLASKKMYIFNKIFGNISYDKSISHYYDGQYAKIDRQTALKRIVQKYLITHNNNREYKDNQLRIEPRIMKKILLVTTKSDIHERFNGACFDALAKLGCQVALAANFESDDHDKEYRIKMEQKGYTTYQIPFIRASFIKNFNAIKLLRELLQQNEYDLVHCHSETAGILTRLAQPPKKHTKYLYTPHGISCGKGSGWKGLLLYKPIEKWICAGMDGVITMNNGEHHLLGRWYPNKTYFIHGIGLDFSALYKSATATDNLRNELGIPKEAKVILSVGELNKRKNHSVILDALPHLKSCYYIICGEGSQRDVLVEKAKKNGSLDRVILPGYRRDISRFYRMADLFVFPSFYEGLPVSLMEAMAFGLPVVCSDAPGNTDLITNGEGGFLCSPTDSDQFQKGINTIMKDSYLAENMKKVNLNKVLAYGKGQVCSEMLEIYKEIL